MLIYTCVFCFISLGQCLSQIPTSKVASGQIIRYASFQSTYVQARNIDIWLPNGFSQEKKYAVVYMHDGQMLFDSTTTFNHLEWGVDETLGKLLSNDLIQNCIVVAIWNTGNSRYSDYFPEKPFLSLSSEDKEPILALGKKFIHRAFRNQQPNSDGYLRFIVKELKPFVDKNYPTKPDPAHTFMAGSSMGGLISLYALCEYPKTFGGAACLSTHFPGIFTNDHNPFPKALFNYISKKIPPKKTHLFYFDYGTETLDSLYEPHQIVVDSIFKANGYTNSNYKGQKFEGENHSETAWKKRLDIPMLFLLGKR